MNILYIFKGGGKPKTIIKLRKFKFISNHTKNHMDGEEVKENPPAEAPVEAAAADPAPEEPKDAPEAGAEPAEPAAVEDAAAADEAPAEDGAAEAEAPVPEADAGEAQHVVTQDFSQDESK